MRHFSRDSLTRTFTGLLHVILTFLSLPCRQLSTKIVCNAANITSQPANVAARTEEPAFRASIDFQALKSNLSVHVQNARDRNSDADPEKVVQLYDRWTQMLMEVERLRSERNANAKAMKVCVLLCINLCTTVYCVKCTPPCFWCYTW